MKLLIPILWGLTPVVVYSSDDSYSGRSIKTVANDMKNRCIQGAFDQKIKDYGCRSIEDYENLKQRFFHDAVSHSHQTLALYQENFASLQALNPLRLDSDDGNIQRLNLPYLQKEKMDKKDLQQAYFLMKEIGCGLLKESIDRNKVLLHEAMFTLFREKFRIDWDNRK